MHVGGDFFFQLHQRQGGEMLTPALTPTLTPVPPPPPTTTTTTTTTTT
jgi:hypothetical protein